MDVTAEAKLKERFGAEKVPMIYEISKGDDGKSLYYPYQGAMKASSLVEEIIKREGKRSE